MKLAMDGSTYPTKQDELLKAGKMARMLAHEIKNPLSRIFLSVEQLKNPDEDDADADFYLDMVKQAGNEIDRIISELVAATLLAEVKMERRSLVDVIRASLALSQNKTVPQSVRIAENYPAEKILMEMDEPKMIIAFQNIIMNAIEAIGAKDGLVEIEVRKKNNSVSISIRDNGCGMSDEVTNNLFIPFYSTKSRKLGLGLTAARNIIVAHKGELELKSEVEKGTEVTLSFPFEN